MTTQQPSPRDIEQATKLFAAFGIHVGILGSVHESEGIEMVAQALAQREAEVRAEYAAFADENGRPRKVLESCDAGNGVYKIGEMLCRNELDAGESVFVLAALAARKEGE
jgi:hypothetical protein